MKKLEMEVDREYIECPDKTCKLWYDEKARCERDCPYREKLLLLKKCWKCEEIIKLPLDYSKFRHLDHVCTDGSTPFILLGGRTTITRYKVK